jgi:hypothetical protein
MTTIKIRKDCKYSVAEVLCILPFKADFITSSIQERMALLKNQILPKMFNYWLENGKEYDTDESRSLSKVGA